MSAQSQTDCMTVTSSREQQEAVNWNALTQYLSLCCCFAVTLVTHFELHHTAVLCIACLLVLVYRPLPLSTA
jgi:hypothetical protein